METNKIEEVKTLVLAASAGAADAKAARGALVELLRGNYAPETILELTRGLAAACGWQASTAATLRSWVAAVNSGRPLDDEGKPKGQKILVSAKFPKGLDGRPRSVFAARWAEPEGPEKAQLALLAALLAAARNVVRTLGDAESGAWLDATSTLVQQMNPESPKVAAAATDLLALLAEPAPDAE